MTSGGSQTLEGSISNLGNSMQSIRMQQKSGEIVIDHESEDEAGESVLLDWDEWLNTSDLSDPPSTSPDH